MPGKKQPMMRKSHMEVKWQVTYLDWYDKRKPVSVKKASGNLGIKGLDSWEV